MRTRHAAGMRARVALVLVTVAAPGAAAYAEAHVTLAPYVQDVRSDGFTVAFETDADAVATVQANGARAETHGRRHEARLDGLAPGARAHYEVSVDGRRVADGEVVLPDAGRPLTFVVFGDTREGGEVEADVARLAARQSPDLILHTGDLVPHGADAVGWRDFFAHEGPLMANVPLYPALGNHEVYRDEGARNFRRYFVLPGDGRERLYYSFRFGPALFIVLDGNAPGPAQTDWLRQQLESAERDRLPHVFVMLHQPPLSVGEHCGAGLAEADWVSLFEEHRVRAVFAGHDHAYARMERRGVRYFISGGGGAGLYAESHSCAAFDLAAKRVYRPVHHLLRVRVDGAQVEISALPLDGAAPIEVTRLSPDEPRFAMEAPSLSPSPSSSPSGAPPWTMAGGAICFVLLGIVVRRKKPR